MYAPTRLAGYAVLLVTPVALLASALFSGGVSAAVVGLEGGVVLAGGVAAATERERALEAADTYELELGDLRDAFAVLAAAVLTYVLSVRFGLGPVVASALVGLVAGVATPRIGVPAYCGSFVGMASPDLFPSVGYLALAGLLSGVAFVAAERAFDGFGGKLGTLALFGCATTAVLTGADFAAGSALAWTDALVVVPVSVAGAVVTAVLSLRLDLGAVVGSALVGLAAGLGLPAVSGVSGGTLAAAAFCASFVGMTSTGRLDGEARVALAGAVCGLVFVAVTAALAGAGGKLGTIAFVSCVTTAGAEGLVVRLRS
ncbi:hypothetical protein M0R88_00580 [Halorussus gelatinilyticus]|uniref:Uncharacterized protein n=1 Tax=Halorussus gelatinilyticus TaxID=2937524 RepID=A0A8U0IK59_9EURY|nr:hypothetical protein [Halorussus gelatinilyticus]UPW00614.1 hypothetical protein M0R88_00580 [Halorussus gelatinilyticus]